MQIKIELTTEEVKELIIDEISSRIVDSEFDPSKVIIKVRSKQNYREKEWESGEFMVSYEGEI
jgi:hypothetical protein